MKKVFLSLIFLYLLVFTNNSYSYISSNIQVKGITNLSTDDTKGNGGSIIFPELEEGVFIDASSLEDNIESDISISGNFWIENLSSSNNLAYGWATFDIGLVSGVSSVKLINNGDSTFLFEGYAWSKTAGWIYFGNTGITNGKVVYNRSTGKIDGCAWSQNIGWLCIDNFNLDTTPPDLSNIEEVFSANYNKNIVLTESDVYSVEVTNWDSSANSIYYSNNFYHDFRKAKNYQLKVTDTSGNYTIKNIKVVAGEPSIILTDGGIGQNASDFEPKSINLVNSNGIDDYEIRFSIRDTYGNPIINEGGIKNVEVEIGFDNNVDLDQIDNFDYGNAILYDNNQFGLESGDSLNSGFGYSSDGDYSIDMSSFAPTKTGYSATSENNDIKINLLEIKVEALDSYSGVGEGTFNIFSTYINKNFRFYPSVYIDNIINSNDWNIIRDLETTFTGEIVINNPNDISDLKIEHLFDTMIPSSSNEANINVSLQKLEDNFGYSNFDGYGYLEANEDNTNYDYKCISSGCDYDIYPFSSSLIYKYNYISSSTNFTNTIKTIARLVLPGLLEYDLRYSSIISYESDGKTIRYPSLSYYKTNSTINNQIKITGLTTDSTSTVIDSDSTIRIGDVSKSLVFKNIKANIVPYQQIGTGVGSVFYTNNDYELNSWPVGIDTIIVDGGDLTISSDIVKDGDEIKSIIALKSENDEKGNIWIKDNVSRIEAVLVTDRSVLSGDGTNFYPDNYAQNQLFIKGSIISYNTIGGASLSTPECPFYIETCSLDIAKKYDLNNFRYYINLIQGDPVLDLPEKDGYEEASMIVEYDSLLQIKTPEIFLLD